MAKKKRDSVRETGRRGREREGRVGWRVERGDKTSALAPIARGDLNLTKLRVSIRTRVMDACSCE